MIKLAKGREYYCSLPFLFKLSLVSAVAISAGGGLGWRAVSDLAFIATLGLIGASESNLKRLLIICISALSIIEPSIFQSNVFIASLLICFKHYKLTIIALASNLIQCIGHINPIYTPIYLLIIYIIISCIHIKTIYLKCFIVLFLILNTFLNIIVIPSPKSQQAFDYKYRIDISDITRKDSAKTYTSIDNSGSMDNSEVYILEHDSIKKTDGNWFQGRKWINTYLYGSELLRIATRMDGYLFSNLGSHIKAPSIRLLGEASYKTSNSYISIIKNSFYFSDSDFLTNSAVGYHKNLLESLFQRFSLSHVIIFGSVLSCIIGLTNIKNTFLLFWNIALITIVVYIHSNQRINIKIVSDRDIWPHSNGVSGIGMEVNKKTGIKYTSKQGKADLLGIERYNTGIYNGEKVVILEGGAKVIINGITVTAPDYPLGENQGIIDAIPLLRSDIENESNSDISINGVRVIGTNSARLNFDAIFQ